MKVIYTKMGIILCFCLSSPCESESFSHSVVSDSLQPHGLQDPLSMGISQARILQWVAILFSRGSFQTLDQTGSPALQADSLPFELPGKPC